MLTKFIEVTQGVDGGFNHGKFMVGRFEIAEWCTRSAMDKHHGLTVSLLGRCGWSERHVLVLDLATGEAAMFMPGGMASADLNKHKVWVCPMFEPFLEWLYKQDLTDLDALPALVELPQAPPAMAGRRREGPKLIEIERDDLGWRTSE